MPASYSAADQQVPVSFLTAEQERRYGRYAGEPSTDQLARHFHLDDADRELATAKRWDHMRLGFAVQLGTVRFLGTFLDDPVDVPAGVSSDMARQLGITDPACLALYRKGRVRWQHARELRAGFGYREFTDPFVHFRLARWLYALCWTGTDRPSVLFDRATAWLVTEKVLLPGASALERLVARIRARAARRLWRTLARNLARLQRAQLDALLVAGAKGRPSPLDRLRDGPYVRSSAELSRAVLLAEACNTGFEPLIRRDNPALRRSRLSWVRQNYIRAETLTRSNAALVAAQNRIALAHAWGGGDVAFADGLRFVVPVRTIHSGPNPRYYGQERGVTFYNLVSDQFTGLNGITVPGTLRDSLTLLSVVLEQQTELQPTEIMSDTGAYTDTIFGIFHLLGYQFSPRLADIGGTRFWRVDGKADYGVLNELAAHRINVALIIQHWEDLLRLAGSLKLGTVQAMGLIRTLQTKDRPTKLARALEELGRLIKTLYLLRFIDDEAYRRRILVQLNRGEGRHQLARIVFHGKRGELRQRYREGQEDQLGALGLVVNVIVLWNTIYMDAALNQLRGEGFDVRDEDVARHSPLGFDHINMLGRYAFILPDQIARGEFRPLRDPQNTDDEG